mmetsp:Transcript_22641/g.42142  ORF Transcript_22641/g.42142 Transcript_22641/m.42142 type:complete len:232 (+) Transcript_22641:119-814(+)
MRIKWSKPRSCCPTPPSPTRPPTTSCVGTCTTRAGSRPSASSTPRPSPTSLSASERLPPTRASGSASPCSASWWWCSFSWEKYPNGRSSSPRGWWPSWVPTSRSPRPSEGATWPSSRRPWRNAPPASSRTGPTRSSPAWRTRSSRPAYAVSTCPTPASPSTTSPVASDCPTPRRPSSWWRRPYGTASSTPRSITRAATFDRTIWWTCTRRRNRPRPSIVVSPIVSRRTTTP